MRINLPVLIVTETELAIATFLAKTFGRFMDICFFVPIALSFVVNVPTSMVWTISNAI